MLRGLLAQHQSKVSPLAFILLLTAFILVLLVNLSTPIIKSIYIMSLKPTVSNGHTIRWGVWGVCTTGTYNATVLLDGGACTGTMLGYSTPAEFLTLIGAPITLLGILTQGLEIVFLFHPLGAGFSAALVVLALFLSSRDMSIAAILIGILGGGAAAIAFAADVAFVVVAKNKVNQLSSGSGQFQVGFGNAVWIQFVAFLLTWGAFILIFANCWFGPRKSL